MPEGQVYPSPESVLNSPYCVYLQKIWNQTGIDLMGIHIEIEGYKYILSVIDYFTNLFELIPLKTKYGKDRHGALPSSWHDMDNLTS